MTFAVTAAFLPAMDALRLVVVFVLIVLALRKKVPVGITLLAAGLVTALLYRLEPSVLFGGYWDLVRSRRFISLTSVVILITILGCLLKELRFLERLSAACRGLPGGIRSAAFVLPALVGMMPMPAGALLSAPLVDDVLKETKCSSELRLATNYWFRHILEFFWPVYAGIILTEGIAGLPMYKVSLLQFPLAVVMSAIGFFFFVAKIPSEGKSTAKNGQALKGIAGSVWPIVLAIAVYSLLRIELAWAVLISLVVLVLVARPDKTAVFLALKRGLSYNLILLVFGILSFQTVVELAGAIDSIQQLAVEYQLPDELVIFSVCFTVGLLTGMVSAFVGLAYTMLATYLYQPAIVPSHIFLAYLSGFVGIMLSPSHLCLTVTIDYFRADPFQVYRRLAPPVLLLGVLGFLIYLTPWSGLF